MNAADWFRKNLKGQIQHRLTSPGKLPRLRKALLGAIERLTRPKKES